MRENIYVPNGGYITSDDSFEYIGNGIIGDVFKAAKDLIFSKEVKDLAIEGTKSFGTTLAKKTGEKAADKLANKIFSKSKNERTVKEDDAFDNGGKGGKEGKRDNTKVRKKNSTDILKGIYGDGIFRQSGKGLKRI